MKLPYGLPRDNRVHTYCLQCGAENVRTTTTGGGLSNRCLSCGHTNPRALVIDPEISWWIGPDREYWHEACGVFVSNQRGEFLFFERTRFPFGLTVPAGHRDSAERPERTAARELAEETGLHLKTSQLVHIATSDTRGDQCRRGADAHRWHCFAAKLPVGATIRIDKREGVMPVWLTLDQALQSEITFVVRQVISHFGGSIRQAVS